jgi:Cu2+-exporting ATPase
MLVFFLLSGRMLEQRLRDRTAGSLDALSRRLPDSVERQRADGSFERVAVRRLAAGDVVRVMPGEAFPGRRHRAQRRHHRGRSAADRRIAARCRAPRARPWWPAATT